MGSKLWEKLQKLQNRLPFITRSSCDTSSSSLPEELNWNIFMSVNRIKLKVTINKRAPLYLQAMFSPNEYVYNLRDSEKKLFVPRPHTEYLKRSFSCSGALLWNSLSESLRLTPNLVEFKTGLEIFVTNHLVPHMAIRQNSNFYKFLFLCK